MLPSTWAGGRGGHPCAPRSPGRRPRRPGGSDAAPPPHRCGSSRPGLSRRCLWPPRGATVLIPGVFRRKTGQPPRRNTASSGWGEAPLTRRAEPPGRVRSGSRDELSKNCTRVGRPRNAHAVCDKLAAAEGNRYIYRLAISREHRQNCPAVVAGAVVTPRGPSREGIEGIRQGRRMRRERDISGLNEATWRGVVESPVQAHTDLLRGNGDESCRPPLGRGRHLVRPRGRTSRHGRIVRDVWARDLDPRPLGIDKAREDQPRTDCNHAHAKAGSEYGWVRLRRWRSWLPRLITSDSSSLALYSLMTCSKRPSGSAGIHSIQATVRTGMHKVPLSCLSVPSTSEMDQRGGVLYAETGEAGTRGGCCDLGGLLFSPRTRPGSEHRQGYSQSLRNRSHKPSLSVSESSRCSPRSAFAEREI